MELDELFNQVMPELYEGYIAVLTNSDPAMLREKRQQKERIWVIVPIPNGLLDGVNIDEITLEAAKARMVAPFVHWFKKIEIQKHGTINDKDDIPVFNLDEDGMIAARFEFSIPGSVFFEES